MIDPHVHLRDWEQSSKETLKHGFLVAHKAGIDAVFEMPNTSPAMTSFELIKKRIEYANAILKELDINLFHGIYAGVTDNIEQIKDVVHAYNTLFPRVVGLKMYAGKSTGDLGITEETKQQKIYSELSKLNYKGILAVHCEKESLFRNDLWDSNKPESHSDVRPSISEVESVKDQIKFAKESNFKGTLHIVHISVPESISIIESERENVNFKITCGVTPHHALLNTEMLSWSYDEQNKKKIATFMKVNPPIRSKKMQCEMFQALFDGRIDWIETDHAPHTLNDKLREFCSGFPGLPFYPKFIKFLEESEFKKDFIQKLTHDNIEKAFNIKIKNSNRKPNLNLEKEYEFDVYDKLI